jgi:hypothetical protein
MDFDLLSAVLNGPQTLYLREYELRYRRSRSVQEKLQTLVSHPSLTSDRERQTDS